MEKIIKLTMTDGYVNDWGTWEAVRELAQNAMDHADKTNTKMKLGYNRGAKQFIVSSKDIKLDVKTLLLGSSTKNTDKTMRGQFGEGYKLAILALLRLGNTVVIHNADEIWIPSFEYDEDFGADLLTITINKKKTVNKDLTFVIGKMNIEQANEISGRLIIDNNKVAGYNSPYGKVLTETRFLNQIFVGGIYVCTPNIKLEHGYNFKPIYVTLGRDRGLIDSFDVQWLASRCWANIDKDDKLKEAESEAVKLIISGSHSMSYYGSSSYNSRITEQVAEQFYSDKPVTAVPVCSQKEFDKTLREYENAVPIITEPVVVNTVKNSNRFMEAKKLLKERLHLTPNQVITNILNQYRGELGKTFDKLSAELIPISLRWKVDDAFEEPTNE